MEGTQLAECQEKLLQAPFSFYQSRMQLSRFEKLSVVKSQLFQTYKSKESGNND
jgi:hypothetical protein